MVRLDDEAETVNDFVVFKAQGNVIEIIAGGTTEILDANVVSEGRARLPSTFFREIARALRFHRQRGTLSVLLLPGSLKINKTEYRHSSISVHLVETEQALAVTKPQKLQNL